MSHSMSDPSEGSQGTVVAGADIAAGCCASTAYNQPAETAKEAASTMLP